MRGKEFANIGEQAVKGITPAYAGKSFFVPNRIVWDKDHPRVCGEKAVFDIFSCHSLGSPPRMRGKAFSGFFGAVFVGITPAYAGKSLRNLRFRI